ncbi:MAG: hypothetical protein LAP40_00140 [Acidobacteriia bacterium]|nr:hypothetical protein [Terriglobia bacterium]
MKTGDKLGPNEIVGPIGKGGMGEVHHAKDKDGRFLIPTPIDQAGTVPMTVVVNWQEMLKRK